MNKFNQLEKETYNKLNAFKTFVVEDKVFQEEVEPKVQALKSFIKNRPINIIKNGEIDEDQIRSYLPYELMVSKKQKELINPKRYEMVVQNFLNTLKSQYHFNTNGFEDLHIEELQNIFQDHVNSHYNIYAGMPTKE
jgi:dephospho-CoA kinase